MPQQAGIEVHGEFLVRESQQLTGGRDCWKDAQERRWPGAGELPKHLCPREVDSQHCAGIGATQDLAGATKHGEFDIGAGGGFG